MNHKSVDFLIIIPPVGTKNTIYPPYGAMYIVSALRQKGYKSKILNVDTNRITNTEIIDRIRQFNPKYLGFSGIVASSYKYIKELSFELRAAFPKKMQILGGGLSSAVEPIFRNTPIDIIVYGEGDVTIAELMDHLENKKNLSGVRGIYYKAGASFVSTGKRELIKNLDVLPYPAFDSIDIDKYLPDGVEFIRNFTNRIIDKRIYDRKRKRKMITIPTSRGCFNECSFCFRAYPGLRVNSIKYVFDFIEYCIEKFNVGFFTFGDECFAPNKERNLEFIEEYKRRKLDIIFRILGMRVDTVDKEILRAYKEIGCWMIAYGFESGSQKMLNIIDKRIAVEKNKDVALWTQEAGIFTSIPLILGMPGETDETIQETINFLKSLNLDFKQYQWKYAIPIPGSHLYNFAKITSLIEDDEAYLSGLTGRVADGIFHINLTGEPDEVVASWGEKINQELDSHYIFGRYKVRNKIITNFIRLLLTIELLYRRKCLMQRLLEKIYAIFCCIFKKKYRAIVKDEMPYPVKNKNINLEGFLKELDYSSVNREMALRKINVKLQKLKTAY